jgi:hypothetical protein
MELNSQLKNAILLMLEQLGVSTEGYRETNGNIQIRCPFAACEGSSHADGTDSNPSFGIKLNGNKFRFNCFTCSDKKGNSLIELIQMLLDHKVIKSKGNAFSLQNAIKIRFPKYYEHFVKEEREVDLDLSVYEELDSEFYEYNKKRGLEKSTIKECGLKYDSINKRVVFSCKDINSKLVGYATHSIEGKKPKYSNECDTGSYLYLEWLIKGKIAVITEGFYDALLAYQHLRNLNLLDKYSAVGMFGAEITMTQIKKLTKYFDRLVLMGDNDEAGIKMEQTIWKKAHKKIPLIMKVRYSGKDVGTIKDTNTFKKYFDVKIPFNVIGLADAEY